MFFLPWGSKTAKESKHRGLLECYRDSRLVSLKELHQESRVQRKNSDFFPPLRKLGVLYNLLKFKGI
ncbi:hypothetical protein MTR_1g038900 [Medicago truncatula]|uniref:Uncharacterized protein n=1 Tax=Medicago truncatula TaxID=3880 RepID=G7IBH5_MEDTR|nr:hypothetical protein MTR_1g038900 [Medicago truncatula]